MDEKPNRVSSRKVLWIVLGIVGGLFLLAALSCGGIIYWGTGLFKEVSTARVVADRFLADVQADRLDSAYALTSSAFQANCPRDQFQAYLASEPAFKNQVGWSYNSMYVLESPGGRQAYFQVAMNKSSGATNFTMILVKEPNTWKVEHLNLPVNTAPKRVRAVPAPGSAPTAPTR